MQNDLNQIAEVVLREIFDSLTFAINVLDEDRRERLKSFIKSTVQLESLPYVRNELRRHGVEL